MKRSAVHNKNTRYVTILWSPDVDYQWDKGHYIFGVEGNEMGYLTILRTLKILTLFNNIFHTT